MKNVNDSQESDLEKAIVDTPIVTNKIIAGTKKAPDKITRIGILINEFKQATELIDIHMGIYFFKFFYYPFFSLIMSCIYADTHILVIVNALLVLCGFVFTAVTVKPQTGQITAFRQLIKICRKIKIYVFVLFFVTLTALVLVATNKIPVANIPLMRFKILVFFLLVISSLITLVEAFYNIPTQALPDEQNKRSDNS